MENSGPANSAMLGGPVKWRFSRVRTSAFAPQPWARLAFRSRRNSKRHANARCAPGSDLQVPLPLRNQTLDHLTINNSGCAGRHRKPQTLFRPDCPAEVGGPDRPRSALVTGSQIILLCDVPVLDTTRGSPGQLQTGVGQEAGCHGS
jgi:hypothetical protein